MGHARSWGTVEQGGIARNIDDPFLYRKTALSRLMLSQTQPGPGTSQYTCQWEPPQGHNRMILLFDFSTSTLATSLWRVEYGVLAPLQGIPQPEFCIFSSGVPTASTIAQLHTIPDGNFMFRVTIGLTGALTVPATVYVTSWRDSTGL